MTTETTIPEGDMVNSQGNLTPIERVSDLDLARNSLVLDMIAEFKKLQKQMRLFKWCAHGEIGAFVEMSAEQYDAKIGGKQGNVTLMSYDGNYKLQLQVSKYITFDERLQVAKALIDECIHDWSEGANSKILALVNDAFQVDKEGNVSTTRILGLRRINITDEKWQQAMKAIADSITTTGSKSYLRAYEREPGTDAWKCITLDFAALGVE